MSSDVFARTADRTLAFLRTTADRSSIKWIFRSVPLAALALTSFTLFWEFPSYDLTLVRGVGDCNYDPFFEQVGAPFTDHSADHPEGTHARNLPFRFVPAILAKFLGIGTIPGAMLFQVACQLVLHWLVILFLIRLKISIRRAFFMAIPVALIAGGHSYASDHWGYFDTLALCFLVGALLVRSSPISVPILVLAYFTDERALVASPAILACELLMYRSPDDGPFRPRDLMVPPVLHLVLSWLGYALIRMALAEFMGLTTGLPAAHFFLDQLGDAPLVLYHGLEGFLFLLLLFQVRSRNKAGTPPFLLFLLSLMVVWAVAISVYDKERSMVYLLPHVLLMLVVLLRELSIRSVDRWVLLVIMVNVLYSDAYPMPAQIFRMMFITGTL